MTVLDQKTMIPMAAFMIEYMSQYTNKYEQEYYEDLVGREKG